MVQYSFWKVECKQTIVFLFRRLKKYGPLTWMDRSTNLDNSRTGNINNSKSKDVSRVEKNMNVS